MHERGQFLCEPTDWCFGCAWEVEQLAVDPEAESIEKHVAIVVGLGISLANRSFDFCAEPTDGCFGRAGSEEQLASEPRAESIEEDVTNAIDLETYPAHGLLPRLCRGGGTARRRVRGREYWHFHHRGQASTARGIQGHVTNAMKCAFEFAEVKTAHF